MSAPYSVDVLPNYPVSCKLYFKNVRKRCLRESVLCFFYILKISRIPKTPNWETTNRLPHTPGVSGGSGRRECIFLYPYSVAPSALTLPSIPLFLSRLRTDRLAQLVDRRTTVRKVSGSSLRPDQHSGS